MPKMNENQFYCLTCKKVITCKDKDIDVSFILLNKTNKFIPILRCSCPKKHKLRKFIKRDKKNVNKMLKKYGLKQGNVKLS